MAKATIDIEIKTALLDCLVEINEWADNNINCTHGKEIKQIINKFIPLGETNGKNRTKL